MDKYQVKKIYVSGMHCNSCEILIEQKVKKINGVSQVKAYQKSGLVEIKYHGHAPSEQDIVGAVHEAGYEVGKKGELPLFSRDANDYKDLFKAVIIVGILYFIIKWSGLLSLSPSTDQGGFFIAWVVGLVAGVSTCMALVGGLVLGLSSRHAELHPEASAVQKFKPHVFFSLGRIVGYAFFGGLIGLIGTAFKMSNNVLGIMTVVVGVVMIFLGLKLVEIFPAMKNQTLSLPSSIAKLFGMDKEKEGYTNRGAMLMGALTFFLPCGFTQAMQIYAISTGSFVEGAIIMALFAIGTAPGLLGIGGLTAVFKGKKARVFFMVAGLAVIFIGWFNIANGKNLISFGGGTASGIVDTQNAQVINMTQNSSGYTPNSFTVKKGVPVKWVINSTSPFSCAASIVMPKYKINQSLKKGENIIIFTPTEIGQVKFTCSMGMYSGVFNVVDSNQALAPATKIASSGGSSCGTGGSSGGGCGGGVPPASSADDVAIPAQANEQVIKTSYTRDADIVPSEFKVKKGVPVRFEVEVKEGGLGCMGTIMVPGLYDKAKYLFEGKTLVMTFTPQVAGDYPITCGMGMPRGNIKVE